MVGWPCQGVPPPETPWDRWLMDRLNRKDTRAQPINVGNTNTNDNNDINDISNNNDNKNINDTNDQSMVSLINQ